MSFPFDPHDDPPAQDRNVALEAGKAIKIAVVIYRVSCSHAFVADKWFSMSVARRRETAITLPG